MKNILNLTLVSALVVLSGAPALAQTQAAPVRIDAVQVQTTTNTDTAVDAKLNPQPDPPSTEVGGDGEDIGTPSEERGNTNIGSSGDDGVETTGIEHEDIGIADPDDEQAMNKADLIESVSTTTTSGADVYIKIGDIKGEADGRKGNVESSWKVEEGESTASKPKEIVVVGSKVRGWDPTTKEDIISAAPASPADVHNETDLAFLMARLVAQSTEVPVEDVTLNFEKIKWEYKQQGRFLGILPISVHTSLEVEDDPDGIGRVKVRLPWYARFVGRTLSEGELIQLWDEQLATVGDDAQLANIDLQNTLQKQAQTLQMMSNVSKMLHDTAMSIIRKLG